MSNGTDNWGTAQVAVYKDDVGHDCRHDTACSRAAKHGIEWLHRNGLQGRGTSSRGTTSLASTFGLGGLSSSAGFYSSAADMPGRNGSRGTPASASSSAAGSSSSVAAASAHKSPAGFVTLLIVDGVETLERGERAAPDAHLTTAAQLKRLLPGQLPRDTRIVTTRLPVGDFAWAAIRASDLPPSFKDGVTEWTRDEPTWDKVYMLGYLLERKNVTDLHAALRVDEGRGSAASSSASAASSAGAAGGGGVASGSGAGAGHSHGDAASIASSSSAPAGVCRFRNQKERMLMCGLNKLMYLFEENFSNDVNYGNPAVHGHGVSISFKEIQQMLSTTQNDTLRDGFAVIRTTRVQESAAVITALTCAIDVQPLVQSDWHDAGLTARRWFDRCRAAQKVCEVLGSATASPSPADAAWYAAVAAACDRHIPTLAAVLARFPTRQAAQMAGATASSLLASWRWSSDAPNVGPFGIWTVGPDAAAVVCQRLSGKGSAIVAGPTAARQTSQGHSKGQAAAVSASALPAFSRARSSAPVAAAASGSLIDLTNEVDGARADRPSASGARATGAGAGVIDLSGSPSPQAPKGRKRPRPSDGRGHASAGYAPGRGAHIDDHGDDDAIHLDGSDDDEDDGHRQWAADGHGTSEAASMPVGCSSGSADRPSSLAGPIRWPSTPPTHITICVPAAVADGPFSTYLQERAADANDKANATAAGGQGSSGMQSGTPGPFFGVTVEPSAGPAGSSSGQGAASGAAAGTGSSSSSISHGAASNLPATVSSTGFITFDYSYEGPTAALAHGGHTASGAASAGAKSAGASRPAPGPSSSSSSPRAQIAPPRIAIKYIPGKDWIAALRALGVAARQDGCTTAADFRGRIDDVDGIEGSSGHGYGQGSGSGAHGGAAGGSGGQQHALSSHGQAVTSGGHVIAALCDLIHTWRSSLEPGTRLLILIDGLWDRVELDLNGKRVTVPGLLSKAEDEAKTEQDKQNRRTAGQTVRGQPRPELLVEITRDGMRNLAAHLLVLAGAELCYANDDRHAAWWVLRQGLLASQAIDHTHTSAALCWRTA